MNYGPTTAIAKRPMATAHMHDSEATGIRQVAKDVRGDLPDMHVHEHLADAAEQLKHRNKEGALRHLHAAMHALAPQSLTRHGVLDDATHMKAKAHLDAINRQALRLRDVMDLEDRNSNLYQNKLLSDPRLAMNAPDQHLPSGGPGNAAEGPKAPYTQGGGTALPAKSWKQAASQSAGSSLVGMANQLDMVGPKGYVHGWKYVGPAPRSEQFSNYGTPGSFQHAQALVALGNEFAPGGERAVPYAVAPAQDTIKNALFHAAKAMVARQMNVANVHMDVAIRAAHTLGPGEEAVIKSAKDSLKRVPKGTIVSHHTLPKYNPNFPDVNADPLYIGNVSGLANGPAPYHRDPDENLRCPNCGKFDDTDARFCDQCGYHFKPADYKNISLSAETGRLAVTPAPRGKPGGPGLYDVKGLGHSPYLQNIVKALIRGGMDPSKAYAVARGSIRKWARGGGNVHPEVRAAAAAAEAQELKAQAQAHAHSNWDQVCSAIELAFNPDEPRGKGGKWTHAVGSALRSAQVSREGGDSVLADVQFQRALHHARSSDDPKAKEVADLLYRARVSREGGDEVLAQVLEIRAKNMASKARIEDHIRSQYKMSDTPGRMELGNWDGVFTAIELAGTAWQQQTRVPAGQAGGGQFGSKGGQQGSPGAGKGGKHHVQNKIAHMNPQQKAHLKHQLEETAKRDLAQAKQLGLQLRALLASLNVHHTGVKASKSPAAAAAAAKRAASTAAKGAAGARKPGSASHTASRAQRLALVASIRNHIHQLIAQAHAAQQQAAKL